MSLDALDICQYGLRKWTCSVPEAVSIGKFHNLLLFYKASTLLEQPHSLGPTVVSFTPWKNKALALYCKS